MSPVDSRAQSTQGLITGRIIDSRSGHPIPSASVLCTHTGTGRTGLASSNSEGFYYLPQLSPGLYRVRVTADAYQAQDLDELELLVAARLELNFRLRPLNDVWEQNLYRGVTLPGSEVILDFYGPDVDMTRSTMLQGNPGQPGKLEATVSEVIEPFLISDLPLAGRDVYTALILLPGVTADTGTARGLGLSIAGQRPSSGSFLLDGLENNNSLVTGPLTAIPPETIEEYRISTNNYAPAYGRTSGFIANAVTRGGGEQFHGLVYFYLQNDALNANGFQENVQGLPRMPAKEIQSGFRAGGPIPRQRDLFWSASYERLRSRSLLDPQTYVLPSANFLAALSSASPVTRDLLQRFPPPAVTPLSTTPLVGTVQIRQPVSVDRSLALARADYRRAKDSYFGRVTFSRLGRPDFIWSPYKDFISGLNDNATSIAFGWEHTFTPSLMNEARAGFNTEQLGWNRAHPEIPTLTALDATRLLPNGTPGRPSTTLPGSPALYSYSNDNRSGEVTDNLTWTHGRHISVFGGGLLIRNTSGYLNLAQDGEYFFISPTAFAQATPIEFYAAVLRGTTQVPDFNRSYRSYPWYLFAQDTFRLTPRLVLNYGLRYEHYGAPTNPGGTLDTIVGVKGGTTVWQPDALTLAGPQRDLYRTDDGGWAPRFGFTYDLTGKGRSVFRAAYGLFYDHPFDNLWQTIRNNNVDLPTFPLSGTINYLAPVPTILAGLRPTPADFPNYTMFDPNFRNARVQNYFYGVQQRIADHLSIEMNGQGALGRHLLTTDIINRDFTTTSGRPDPQIPYDVEYRAPQGSSSYQALTAAARLRTGWAQAQISYTWSHSIDNQSEPLAFDTFNLYFTQLTSGTTARVSAFSRQFDSSADRGTSDFDQRQNLVFFSVWSFPAPPRNGAWRNLLRDWKFAQLAAFRSGFPYTVYANAAGLAVEGAGLIEPGRANLDDPANAMLASPVNVPGGKVVLNRAAFSAPVFGVLGTAGRNALTGPGLYNIDISLSRSFAVPWLRENGRLTVRADAFNFLNHANLNNPASDYGARTNFGTELYGRQELPSGFPSIFPLNETARQVQLMLRVEW